MNPSTAIQLESTPAAPEDAVQRKRRLPPAIQSRLKAERVEERLRSMPGWKLSPGKLSIFRVLEFPAPRAATAYTAFATTLAEVERQPIEFSLHGRQVVLTLAGPARGPRRGLTQAVLDLANRLA